MAVVAAAVFVDRSAAGEVCRALSSSSSYAGLEGIDEPAASTQYFII